MITVSIFRPAVLTSIVLLIGTSYANGIPSGASCDEGKTKAAVIQNEYTNLTEGKLKIAFKYEDDASALDPEYFAVTLSENNLVPSAGAAIIGKQSGGATKTVVFEKKSAVATLNGRFYLPDIKVEEAAPVTVSMVGYRCNLLDPKYSSSVSVYTNAGLLQRAVGGKEKLRAIFYAFPKPERLLTGNTGSPPAGSKTVAGIITFPLDLCSKGCKIVTNLKPKDTISIDPSSVSTTFPSNSSEFESQFSSSTADEEVVVKKTTEKRYYVLVQRNMPTWENVRIELLGQPTDVGGGVLVYEGFDYVTTRIANQDLEDAIGNLTESVYGKSVQLADLNTPDYLRAKFFSFVILQVNSLVTRDVSDVVSHLVGSLNSSSTSIFQRMGDQWGALLSANLTIGSIRPSGFQAVDGWVAPMPYGVFSRVGISQLDKAASVKGVKKTSKMKIRYSENIEVFYRNEAGKFIKLGLPDCCVEEDYWGSRALPGLNLIETEFVIGGPVWKQIRTKGLWAKPFDRYEVQNNSDSDNDRYQIRITYDKSQGEKLFVGEISKKDLIGLPNISTGLPSEGDSWRGMMPISYRFNVQTDQLTEFPVDKSSISANSLKATLKCVSGCGNNLPIVTLNDASIKVEKSALAAQAQTGYQYILTDEASVGGIDKYLAEIPFRFLTHHDYIITGYGSSSDLGTRNMEGLAILHARHLIEQGKFPELIRISRIYGQEPREIQLNAGSSYEGLGVSFYELNKFLFSGKKVGEVTFFGHGGINGTSLGKLINGRGSLGFFYGYSSSDYSNIPAFEGSFASDATVNLYQCLGSAFYNKTTKEMAAYSSVKLDDPAFVKPIAQRLAQAWLVPVSGFNWLGIVATPRKDLNSPKYIYGLFSQQDGDTGDISTPLSDGKGGIIWAKNTEEAKLSRYSSTESRVPVQLPSYLKFGYYKSLPKSMSIDCLRGYSCPLQ